MNVSHCCVYLAVNSNSTVLILFYRVYMYLTDTFCIRLEYLNILEFHIHSLFYIHCI